MSEIEKHRGIGDVCRRGFHEKCPAPAACRCECHGEKVAVVEKFTCTACPESFDRASRLREHERRHIREGLIARQAPEAPLEAPERPAGGFVAFDRPKQLAARTALGEPLACPEPGCDRSFAAPQGLASHRRTHATTAAQIEAAATNGERVPRGTDDEGWEPAGTITLNDDGSQTWEPAQAERTPLLDDPARDVAEYDARMAALADDLELAWPHRCAERYVLLLIEQLAESGHQQWAWRGEMMDRIERVLGLHPTPKE